MNWDAIGAIGTLVGSIAVIATLVYLARQVRESTMQSRVESISKGIETQVHQLAHLADEEEKADLVRRAIADFDGLTRAEKGRVHSLFLELCLAHNVLRHSYNAGLLAEGEFIMLQHNWLSLMRTSGARVWFKNWRHMTPPDFRAYVDSVLDNADLAVKPLDQEVPWLFGEVQSNIENFEPEGGAPKDSAGDA